MSYNLKYLKYKQKYLNLKKIIGAGMDAEINIDSDSSTVKLIYIDNDGEQKELMFNIINEIGSGSYGKVFQMKEKTNQEITYILKLSKKTNIDIFKEGRKSNNLKNILDDQSLILFQGIKIYGKLNTDNVTYKDFLISYYNGNDLEKEYNEVLSEEEKINKIGSILNQLLNLIYKLNKNPIQKYFHNDIKLQNIVINKKDVVRLIDFGLLDNNSYFGTPQSMSYKSLVKFMQNQDYTLYESFHDILLDNLIDTDIFGFFYCCIDLLGLLNKKNYCSYTILYNLKCACINYTQTYNLFDLYFFILPETFRNKINIEVLKNIVNKMDVKSKEAFLKEVKIIKKHDYSIDFINLFDLFDLLESGDININQIIENLEQIIHNIDLSGNPGDIFLLPNPEINFKIPTEDKTKEAFEHIQTINTDYINLYRYILFIYEFLEKNGVCNLIETDNLKKFLLGISKCLLADFDHDTFIKEFPELIKLLIKK